MSSEFVQNVLIRIRSDGSVEVAKLGDQFKNLGQQAAGARGGMNQFSEALGSFGSKLAVWAAGLFTIQKAIQALRAGISEFDEIRTLSGSLTVLTGSSRTAGAAIDYFEKMAGKTASTGHELARVFRDEIPMAMRAKLDLKQLQDLTVLFGMIAKSGMATTEQLGNAFSRLLSGHIRQNELLMITGQRIEDITRASDKDLEQIGRNVAKQAIQFSKIPDTFEIVMKRVKSAFAESFAVGMAGSTGTAMGLEEMKKKLLDPKLLKGIQDIGQAFGDLLPRVAALVALVAKLATPPKWMQDLQEWWKTTKIGLALEPGGKATGGGGGGGWAGLGGFEVGGGAGGAPEESFEVRVAKAVTAAMKAARDAVLEAQKGTRDLGSEFEQIQASVQKAFRPDLIDPLAQQLQAVDDLVATTRAELVKTEIEWAKIPGGGVWVKAIREMEQSLDGLGAALKQSKLAVYWKQQLDEMDAQTKQFRQSMYEKFNSLMEEAAKLPQGISGTTQGGLRDLYADLTKQFDAALESGYTPDMLKNLIHRVFDQPAEALVEGAKRLAAAMQAVDQYFESMAMRAGQVPGMPVGFENDIARMNAMARGQLKLASMLGESPAGMERIQRDWKLIGDEWFKVNVHAAEQFLKMIDKFQSTIIDPLIGGFADLLTTGGKNLSSVFGQSLAQSIGSGVSDLFGSLVGALGGAEQISPGVWKGGGRTFGSQSQAGMAGIIAGDKRVAAGALGFTTGFAQGYYGPQQTGWGATLASTGVQFGASIAATYAALGTIPVAGWVAAAALAVGQIIGKLLQPSVGKDYPYAIPHLKGPTAEPTYGTWADWEKFGVWKPGLGISWTGGPTGGMQNVPATKLKQMEAEIRAQFETFWGGYLDILISVGAKIMPKLSDFKLDPTTFGVDKGADFGKEASSHFWEHYQEWIEGKLPREIANYFYKPLETAFMSFGGSAGKFKALWTELEGLDPKKAVELWTSIFKSLKDITKAMTYFETPFGFGKDPFGRGGMFDSSSLWNQGIASKYKSFSTTIADIDKQIFDLADELGNMTTQKQIETLAQINTLIQQRYEAERNYIRQLIDMIEDANRTFQQNIEEYKTATMTPAEKYAYYQQEVERHRQAIGTARTPEEAMQAWSDLQADMPKLIQAGLDAGVKAADIYASATGFITTVHDELVQKLIDFGTSIDEMNRTFTEKFTPIWNEWMGKLTDSGDDLDNLSRSAADAGVKLSDFATEVSSATGAIVEFRRALSAPGASAQSAPGSSDFSSYVRSRRLGG